MDFLIPIPKHHNHKFQRDYEKIINDLTTKKELKIDTIIIETKKMLDNHVEYHYNNLQKNEISSELLNDLYNEINKLRNENKLLNDINIDLHKRVFDLEIELKSTLEGIVD